MKKMDNKKIINIPMHFDTGDIHYLPVDDFISFSNDMKNIVCDFNKIIFDNSLNIKVIILPPEDGTFLNKMGIIIVGGTIFVAQTASFTDTDYGKGLVMGLTGNNPVYYGEKHGELIKDVSIGFLEKTTEELKNIIKKDDEKKLSKSYFQKSNFYQKCIDNVDIKGVEFADVFSDFKITRDGFLSRIKTEDDDTWSEYKLHELIVVAPVNIKNKTQQWKMKDKENGEPINFFMEDRKFLLDYLTGDYPLKETEKDDVMVVMVKYDKKMENGLEKVIKKEAIKVYKINNEELSPVPKDTTIEGIVISVDKIRNNIPENQENLLNLIDDEVNKTQDKK